MHEGMQDSLGLCSVNQGVHPTPLCTGQSPGARDGAGSPSPVRDEASVSGGHSEGHRGPLPSPADCQSALYLLRSPNPR